MRWIANLLTALRSAEKPLVRKSLLEARPSSEPCRAEFTEGDLRVRVYGPYVCDHYELELQIRGVQDQWFTLGLVNDEDVYEIMYLLLQAENYVAPLREVDTAIASSGKNSSASETWKIPMKPSV